MYLVSSTTVKLIDDVMAMTLVATTVKMEQTVAGIAGSNKTQHFGMKHVCVLLTR